MIFRMSLLETPPLPPITAYTSIQSAFLPRSMVFRSHLPIIQYRTLMMHNHVTVLLQYRHHFSCIDECSSFVVGASEYFSRASIRTDMWPCRDTRWVAMIMITSAVPLHRFNIHIMILKWFVSIQIRVYFSSLVIQRQQFVPLEQLVFWILTLRVRDVSPLSILVEQHHVWIRVDRFLHYSFVSLSLSSSLLFMTLYSNHHLSFWCHFSLLYKWIHHSSYSSSYNYHYHNYNNNNRSTSYKYCSCSRYLFRFSQSNHWRIRLFRKVRKREVVVWPSMVFLLFGSE